MLKLLWEKLWGEESFDKSVSVQVVIGDKIPFVAAFLSCFFLTIAKEIWVSSQVVSDL